MSFFPSFSSPASDAPSHPYLALMKEKFIVGGSNRIIGRSDIVTSTSSVPTSSCFHPSTSPITTRKQGRTTPSRIKHAVAKNCLAAENVVPPSQIQTQQQRTPFRDVTRQTNDEKKNLQISLRAKPGRKYSHLGEVSRSKSQIAIEKSTSETRAVQQGSHTAPPPDSSSLVTMKPERQGNEKHQEYIPARPFKKRHFSPSSILCEQPRSPTPPTIHDEHKTRSCGCQKNACLKLYCDCFAGQELCSPEYCCCSDCGNLDRADSKRQIAIESARSRKAFSEYRPTRRERKASGKDIFCGCKKSRCLKRYCDCFFARARCSERCGCIDCYNRKVHDA